MKHFFILILVCCSAFLQAQSYISTAGDMKVEAADIKSFADPNITVNACYSPVTNVFIVTLDFWESAGLDDYQGQFILTLSKTTVDTFTGTGTGDTEKWQNAVEQAVVDYLEGINGAIFTIN